MLTKGNRNREQYTMEKESDYNSKKELISNELIPFWNGNHVHVAVVNGDDMDRLTISMISHTLPNLLERQVGMKEWVLKSFIKQLFKP
ncbi:hypothetical protein AUF15_08195 [Enterococcus avium]|uniref:hypothetical protein n=1 Tax=Enterococcus avium TaxID=33945 RepID=UPI001193D3FB|nr:hypothetical protein [Enterococcus avium]TRZ30910.1 hypothetical protein AUF15_08195 [Enterococcus avium]